MRRSESPAFFAGKKIFSYILRVFDLKVNRFCVKIRLTIDLQFFRQPFTSTSPFR